MSKCDVVYKISCRYCDAMYINQTKKQLQTRIQEHLKDINQRSGCLSIISDHRLTNMNLNRKA